MQIELSIEKFIEVYNTYALQRNGIYKDTPFEAIDNELAELLDTISIDLSELYIIVSVSEYTNKGVCPSKYCRRLPISLYKDPSQIIKYLIDKVNDTILHKKREIERLNEEITQLQESISIYELDEIL